MVKQRRFADLSNESKERMRSAVRRFTKCICSETSPSGLGALRMRDANGRPRKLYPHQVVAAQRLLIRDGRAPWVKRKASLLAIHEVGSGKTVMAILVLVAVRVLNPHRSDTKTLIVCPLSVLEMWHDTVRAWTTLGDEQVLAAPKQAALTEEAIARASVIITTPETLVVTLPASTVASKQRVVAAPADGLVIGASPSAVELSGSVHPTAEEATLRRAQGHSLVVTLSADAFVPSIMLPGDASEAFLAGIKSDCAAAAPNCAAGWNAIVRPALAYTAVSWSLTPSSMHSLDGWRAARIVSRACSFSGS